MMPGRISKVPLLTFSCLLALPLHHSMAQTDSTQAKYGITQEQYQYVLTESAKGGKLDFEAQMGEKYFVLIDSIAYDRRSGALVVWGQAMKQLGVRTAEAAVSLYQEILQDTLRVPQRKAIMHGFNRQRR